MAAEESFGISFTPLIDDSYEGSTLGKAQNITFSQGKTGLGAVLGSPDSSIRYEPNAFAGKSGRIEFDFRLTKKMPAGRKHWCLLSDVGASSARLGNIVVMWPGDEKTLNFGIFDGNAFHWCKSKTTDWQPDRWYHLSLSYGIDGMSLGLDGIVEATDPWTGGLADTGKTLGYHDGFMDTPKVQIDNFRTFRRDSDMLELTPECFSPNNDGIADTCTIRYGLARKSTVTLDVIDRSGKILKRLVKPGTTLLPGEYEIAWNGSGRHDGEYTVRLSFNSHEGEKTFEKKVRIDNRWKWKKNAAIDKSFFPIGVWYFNEDDATGSLQRTIKDDAKAKNYYDRTMDDLGSHGINFAVLNWTPQNHWKMALDAAGRNGIKCIVHMDKINDLVASGPIEDWSALCDKASALVKDVKDRPEVAGYYIVDEPLATPMMAKNIRQARQAIETVDPKHTGFSCMMPCVEYEYLMKNVDYQALVLDCYVIGKDWNGDFTPYTTQLARAQRCVDDKKPYWIILQTFATKTWGSIPTPEAIRAQVWLGLAYGAKGVIYFIYQSTTQIQGECLVGLVGMDLKPTDNRWSEVAKINSDVSKLAPTLVTLKQSKRKVSLSPGITSTAFVGPKGDEYVIVVNPDTKKVANVSWTLGAATDVLTGNPISKTISLPAGGGKLIRLNK
jgi:hypothetical protein